MRLSIEAKKRDEKFNERFVVVQDGDFFVIMESLPNGQKQIKDYKGAKSGTRAVLELMCYAYKLGWEDGRKHENQSPDKNSL